MNTPDASINISVATSVLRDSVAAGASREELIRRMREMSLNMIGSIKLLRELLGIPLSEAKAAVHFSGTWADLRESHDALHEAAFSTAKELGYIEDHVG